MAAKGMSNLGMGDAFEPFALGMQLVGGAVGARGAYAKSKADKAAYGYQADVMDTNATIEHEASKDALRRGQTSVVNSELKTRQLKGEQTARMAANGVDLSTGSPLNILTDTDFMGANDATVLAMNAAKEAWGHDVRAMNDTSNAEMLRRRAGMESPGMAAGTSLLTTGGQVASRWYSTRNPYLGG